MEELIIRVDGKITKYYVIKKVMSTGDGGHIVVPKDLVGKNVEVIYGFTRKELEK